MRRVGRGLGVAVVEVVAIAREAVLIPARLWMSAAESAGAWTLAVWHVVKPVLLTALDVLRASLRIAERIVTPARAVAVVAVCSAAVLVGSQFADYRGVQIGAPEYRGVSNIAAAPETAKRTPRDEHGLVLVAVAALSVLVTAAAMGGRWRLARVLLPLGAVALGVALLGDAPAGLDEGRTAIAYQGAHAVLLGPFWAEVAAGLTLALCGLLLPGYLSAEQGEQRSRRRSRPSPPRPSRVQGAHP